MIGCRIWFLFFFFLKNFGGFGLWVGVLDLDWGFRVIFFGLVLFLMVLFWFWLVVVFWNIGVDIFFCVFGVFVWVVVFLEGFFGRFYDDNEKYGILKDVKK